MCIFYKVGIGNLVLILWSDIESLYCHHSNIENKCQTCYYYKLDENYFCDLGKYM